MSEEPIAAAPPSRPPYTDRSGALAAFGVVQILIALGCLALVAFVVGMAGVMARRGVVLPSGARPMGLRQAALSSAVYLFAAVAFAWLGAGSILARRWARTLTLILAWFWLVTGVFTLLATLLLLTGPGIFAIAVPGTQGPGGVFVLGCVGVFLFLFFVLLPGVFVLFYRSPDVRATCEARDPVVRWTDRCPAPVLALSLAFAVNVIYFPLSLFYGSVFPVFGVFLSGLPGIGLRLALAVICGMIAVGLYRLQPTAWWCVLGVWIVGFASAAVTFRSPANWRELYRQMGFPPEQVETSAQLLSHMLTNGKMLALLVAGLVAALSYLLWIRRYFVAAREE